MLYCRLSIIYFLINTSQQILKKYLTFWQLYYRTVSTPNVVLIYQKILSAYLFVWLSVFFFVNYFACIDSLSLFSDDNAKTIPFIVDNIYHELYCRRRPVYRRYCTIQYYYHGTYITIITQKMLRPHEGKNVRFVTALDLIKCLKQIRQQRLPFTCAFMD